MTEYNNSYEETQLDSSLQYLNILKEKEKAEQLIRENPDNFSIINIEIKKNFEAFKYVSDRLKNDFNFVRYIVSRNGLLIEYASYYLKNNFIIAKTAINNNDYAYKFISNRLKKNNEIINLVGKINANAVNNLFDKSIITTDIILNIINNSININYNFINIIPQELLTQEIAFKLIKRNIYCFLTIPIKLINNDILLYIIEKNYLILILKRNIKITDENLILNALKLNSEYINYIPLYLLSNKNFALKIVSINSDFISKLSNHLEHDRDIIICAINNNIKCIKYNNILLYNQVWNIQWNFNKYKKNYIKILKNIKYMPFTNNIEKLLHIILSNNNLKKIIINKYSYYLIDIFKYNSKEYIALFEIYDIIFLNINLDEEIKKIFIEHNLNKIILFY